MLIFSGKSSADSVSENNTDFNLYYQKKSAVFLRIFAFKMIILREVLSRLHRLHPSLENSML